MTVTFFSWANALSSGGGGSGGGADPAANVNITGQWQCYDPTTPNGLANKQYVDNAVNRVGASGAITTWTNTTNYTLDAFVVHNKAIWVCRTANINSEPTLANNNWRQEANLDSALEFVFSGSPITASTYTFPTTQTSAIFNTSLNNITVTMPTIASMTTSDTPNRIREYRLFKTSQANNLIINLGTGNTFSDGSNSINVSATGSVTLFALFNSTSWYRG